MPSRKNFGRFADIKDKNPSDFKNGLDPEPILMDLNM
jgi:hypothetical protein